MVKETTSYASERTLSDASPCVRQEPKQRSFALGYLRSDGFDLRRRQVEVVPLLRLGRPNRARGVRIELSILDGLRETRAECPVCLVYRRLAHARVMHRCDPRLDVLALDVGDVHATDRVRGDVHPPDVLVSAARRGPDAVMPFDPGVKVGSDGNPSALARPHTVDLPRVPGLSLKLFGVREALERLRPLPEAPDAIANDVTDRSAARDLVDAGVLRPLCRCVCPIDLSGLLRNVTRTRCEGSPLRDRGREEGPDLRFVVGAEGLEPPTFAL
jgi:hypothetical protein